MDVLVVGLTAAILISVIAGVAVGALDGWGADRKAVARAEAILPGREHVLAHKLMIEAAEDEYTRSANVVWRAGQATVLGGRAWWD